MTRTARYRLVDGPPELVRHPRPPDRQDLERLTIRWRNGYEHYELDEAATHASEQPVYRWSYRTMIAE
ncbi:DUF5988 family protein [Streptomyces sp. NPDC050617]|uniref:DUF5988 family protein n=1 Tax=Streptomyces sp. NPDC050617 TaxID=3154628 RepID=UPI0034400DAA